VKEELFFFEKKNQKTFIHCSSDGKGVSTPLVDKSLFASFSSEKEVLPSFPYHDGAECERQPCASPPCGLAPPRAASARTVTVGVPRR
jgi:hypothetical protein